MGEYQLISTACHSKFGATGQAADRREHDRSRPSIPPRCEPFLMAPVRPSPSICARPEADRPRVRGTG